jgi:hypothetical protein
MAVNYDRVLPMPVDVGVGESVLNEAEIALRLIEKLCAGKTELVARLEVQSEAVGSGTRPTPLVDQTLEKMKKESMSMRGVAPVKFKDQTEYLAALDMVSELIPSSEWLTRLKACYKASTFTALVNAINEEKVLSDAERTILEGQV